MNTQLQQLIEELKDEKSKALAESKKYMYVHKETRAYHDGKHMAFDLAIHKLTKILNEGSVAAREDIHFRVDFKNGKIIRTRRG